LATYSEPVENGLLLSTVNAAPGAGSQFAVTFGTNLIIELLSAHFTIVTSAVVVNRFVRLTFFDGTQDYWQGTDEIAMIASNTYRVSAYIGGVFKTLGNTNNRGVALPHRYTNAETFTFRSDIVSIDVGDVIGAQTIKYRQWFVRQT
jgi:hypothetical protein